MQFISFFLFLATAIETNGQHLRALTHADGDVSLELSMSHVELGLSDGTMAKSGKSSKSGEPEDVDELTASLPIAAPFCTGIGASCTSGNLLLGVGADSETHTNPVTSIDGCQDGNLGVYLEDESVERITVSAVEDGQVLQAGHMARIDALVHAYDCTLDEAEFPCDFAHFYSTNDINFPTWNFLGTSSPGNPGLQTVGVQFVLPEGGVQAVRVAFGFFNLPQSPCPPVPSFNDIDDLIFSVAVDADDTTAVSAQGTNASPVPNCVSFGKKRCSVNPSCQWNSDNGSCSLIEN